MLTGHIYGPLLCLIYATAELSGKWDFTMYSEKISVKKQKFENGLAWQVLVI